MQKWSTARTRLIWQMPAATWRSNSSAGTLASFCQLDDWS
jgi:hypothetical protein